MTPINLKPAQKRYLKSGTFPFTNLWKLPPPPGSNNLYETFFMKECTVRLFSVISVSCTVTALFLHILDDCITVGNQLSKSTWIQRLKTIVCTKFLKAGVNFSRADIAVGLRFIMLKNPVQIYRKGQEYWYSSHSKPYDEEKMK